MVGASKSGWIAGDPRHALNARETGDRLELLSDILDDGASQPRHVMRTTAAALRKLNGDPSSIHASRVRRRLAAAICGLERIDEKVAR